MKYLITFIILQIIFAQSANAKPASCLAPKELVQDLYKNFSPLGDDTKDIGSQNINILRKYFSKKLSSLIDKDNKCELKNNGICKLDYGLLTDSQDIYEDTKIIFLKSKRFDDANVMVTFHDSNKFIKFNFVNEKGCYLIDDIVYKDNRTLKKVLK